MALQQEQIDGAAARDIVRQRWPEATSSYTGSASAEVYDPASGVTLGEAHALEYAVERAWIAAAAKMQKRE